MTTILRIQNVVINSSSSISVTFTENITQNIVAANVSILSKTNNVSDSLPILLAVSGSTLTITCQPLIPYAAYLLQFQNTANNPFISVNGDAKISQDGVSNVFLITGPIQSDNPVYDYLQSFYSGNIYNATDYTTVVNSYLQSIAVNFAQALYSIRQLKNENYLSVTIIDEQHTRGTGPYDRLYEEATYDVFRVGFGPSGTPVSNTFIFTDFPYFPVTLQKQVITQTIKPSSNDEVGTFNVDTLTFNLSNSPVTVADSIVFNLTTTNPTYTYDIQTLGYQLLNSTYDQAYASSYLLLKDNQIKLNEAILADPNFSLDQIFSITIQYEYKNLGIVIDPNTLFVDVYTTLQSVREVIPPIINIFNLQHAPITDANNNIPITGGVSWLNPNSDTGAPHPAFLMEIPFSLSALPAAPGVYSVDYPTGTVYVYGADATNDGTGPTPPLATYYYQFTYVSEIDYVYDEESSDLVALPLGNLINRAGTITFNYEQVLIPGIDYTADTHIESIYEPINNNLTALNALVTQNSPITNVFQIINETSGEIYLLDRWNDDVVYFRYNTPPRVLPIVHENATFLTIANELLGVNTTSTNANSLRVFTIFLANNNIINATQDAIAASFNTSLFFTNGNVFVEEIWYNQEFNSTTNINVLSNVGEYTVDYENGIIYVAVSHAQMADIGTATYKINTVVPNDVHLVSVEDIYYQISVLNPKNKHFTYASFGDDSIVVENMDVSDEGFLNGVLDAPYQLYQGMVGAFIINTFVPGVTNAVKFVRSVFEFNDLVNSTNPLNFAFVSTSNNFNINVGSITGQSFENVQFNNGNYFVTINQNIPYLSPDITYSFSVVRVSDSQVLWNSGTVVPGNPVQLILNAGNPHLNDLVNVNYTFTINTGSRVIVDYNKGDFFVDYTYVADEILVSYEYGDNVLDFSQNTNLPSGTTYYVSYKVGALRDTLLQNFGTLINVPGLSTLDLSLNRERYRDALMAALSSFIQGPTVAAIKNIGQIISHIEPQVIESAFQVWSLGNNLLNPVSVQTTGAFQLLPAHFDSGVLIDQPEQTISMPANSNIRLEEGTFETWILPQWNGLDNDADLTFTITVNGQPIRPFRIFIGGSGYHPVIANGSFTLNKGSNVTGLPNTNKDGVFIYYANDPSGSFQRWYIQIIDGYVVSPNFNTYKFQIASSGKFYDLKPISGVRPSNMTTFTGTNNVNLTIAPLSDGYGINQGITFLSDSDKYILDFGLGENYSRLSIYKDASGYMNFRTFDKYNRMYMVSADVSAWKINSEHMVAASWKLNTRNSQDEMHLFIDGLEVPNITKYGQKLQPYLHEKFRTVDPEQIVDLSPYDIVGSDDLVTIQGSPTVTSSINFNQFNIFAGNTLFINENGFSSTGYTINAVEGQTLILAEPMPLSIANGNYSVNQTQYTITSEINIAPNIAVSTIHAFLTGNDLMSISDSSTVTSTTVNFTQEGVLPGFMISIDNDNFATIYSIGQVNGHSLTIDSNAPLSLSGLSFQIYSNIENELPGVRALVPDYNISQDVNFNNILTVTNGVFKDDLILIRLLGLNFRDVKKQYYVWSDGYENTLKTQLPPPINLDEVSIIKVIVPITAITTTNSIIVGSEVEAFIVDGYTDMDGYTGNLYQPSNEQNGRTLQVNISGTNVAFMTAPVLVTINGVTESGNASETITFTDYGTLDSVNQYTFINYIQIQGKPINSARGLLAITVKEKYPITYGELNEVYPVIRYSYQVNSGYNLQATGFDNFVTDGYNLFSYMDIGNYIVINSPAGAAGTYLITGISADRTSVSINTVLPHFTGGVYKVLNTTSYRSGLQNGFFIFELYNAPGQPWFLNHGFYELDYSTYATIKFAPLNDNMFFGSDFKGQQQVNSILEQLTVSSVMLTDTRVGEVVAGNAYSITKDYNSIKAPKPNANTLVLLPFDIYPFENTASFYANTNNDHIHFQSDWAVNDNFGQSIVILDKPIEVTNAGILDTTKQATIEFWMSPLYDMANDPNTRYYFDAYGAVVEQVTSISNVAVKISAPASRILNVTLTAGNPAVDYFAGGSLEIDTQRAIQEEAISIGNAIVTVSQPILQVITVKIIGDPTGQDYFNNGSISSNGQTIYLGTPLPQNSLPVIVTYQTTSNDNTALNTQVIRLNRALPAQNSGVTVTYIPSGLQGDRVSLYKDQYGYMNFAIVASGTTYIIQAPTYWTRNTWHRVKASYIVNGMVGTDEMRLFLDGYQYANVLFGTDGVVSNLGQFPSVVGSSPIPDSYKLISGITFKDPINDLTIGTDYAGNNPIFTLLDNFRISNVSRAIYAPYGEPIDVNYSSNLSMVFPVTQDLYTTYLMNFNTMFNLTTNFATLINRETGAFEFTVNIFDSFGIVSGSMQVQQILEELINILKPATSTAFIKYFT